MTSSEEIFYAGIALVSLAALIAAIVTPILVVTGLELKRRLNADYGEKSF